MPALPTPGAILDYWMGPATNDHLAAQRKNKLWFVKSAKTDQFIEQHFLETLKALSEGLAYDCAEQGPRQRLAAIIVLDQFSRNIFRGAADSFAQDKMALGLCKEGLLSDQDKPLSEGERAFFYMPLEHSERLTDQDLCVSLFEKLAKAARPAFKPLCQNSLDYAYQHRDVIRQFGRFPHRNAILGRSNTPEEAEYLSKPGSGF